MSKPINEALPQDEEGRTYVTDQMLVEDSDLAALYQRTRNSWHRDETRCRYLLYPSVGKS